MEQKQIEAAEKKRLRVAAKQERIEVAGQKRLKTAPEVAAALGVDVKAVYRYTRHGEFDDFLVKVGDRPQYRYRPDGLADYVKNGGSKAESAGME